MTIRDPFPPTLSRPALWQTVADWEVPQDAAGVPFSEQLRKKAKIGQETAWAAIREYRRFLYRAALEQGRRVPPGAVGIVRDLHQARARDDWECLWAAIGRPVLRSSGARSEAGSTAVEATLRVYEREFGRPPPKGIWRYPDRKDQWRQVGGGVLCLAIAVWIALDGAPLVFVVLLTGMALLMFIKNVGVLAATVGIHVASDPTLYWGAHPEDDGFSDEDGDGDGD